MSNIDKYRQNPNQIVVECVGWLMYHFRCQWQKSPNGC